MTTRMFLRGVLAMLAGDAANAALTSVGFNN